MGRPVPATAAAQLARVRELFAEYARLVDEPCCFADFEAELASLPAPISFSWLMTPAASRYGFWMEKRRR